MLCYKDKCYCIISNENFAGETGKKVCTNTKCPNHCAEIPFDKLPEWMPISYSDFSERCGEYKE